MPDTNETLDPDVARYAAAQAATALRNAELSTAITTAFADRDVMLGIRSESVTFDFPNGLDIGDPLDASRRFLAREITVTTWRGRNSTPKDTHVEVYGQAVPSGKRLPVASEPWSRRELPAAIAMIVLFHLATWPVR